MRRDVRFVGTRIWVSWNGDCIERRHKDTWMHLLKCHSAIMPFCLSAILNPRWTRNGNSIKWNYKIWSLSNFPKKKKHQGLMCMKRVFILNARKCNIHTPYQDKSLWIVLTMVFWTLRATIIFKNKNNCRGKNHVIMIDWKLYAQPKPFRLSTSQMTVFILHTSYFILHTSYFILHTSYFILHTSYFILHASYFILHTSYFILHGSMSIAHAWC